MYKVDFLENLQSPGCLRTEICMWGVCETRVPVCRVCLQ